MLLRELFILFLVQQMAGVWKFEPTHSYALEASLTYSIAFICLQKPWFPLTNSLANDLLYT